MAVLSKDERSIIQQRLLQIGSPNLALIFGDVTGEDASWTLNQPPAVVVVLLIGRLSESRAMAITVCDQLVLMIPNGPSNPELNAIGDRLRTQAAQAVGNPLQELWIGAEPMVNRSGLRALLDQIANGGFNHSVIYIAGGPMSGRSHSFQLIRHVARSMDIRHHMVDFALASEARTLRHLYGALREVYAINADGEPTHEGATPGDVATKFAVHLRSRLATATPVNPKPWIVIDFSDEVSDPAVPEFIRLFCADRDANLFDNCVLFILGPSAHLDSMRGELQNMQIEELYMVSQTEIYEAAEALNKRASQQLDDVALHMRAKSIYSHVMHLPERDQFPALRRSLLEMRREVRAP